MTQPSTENLIEGSRPDTSAVLHHIDKLYSTQTRIWESLNRIMITQMILSAILIALSSGVISLDEGFEVTGIKFKISLTVILSGGAFAITVLSAAFLSQWNQSDALQLKIKALYKTIGYEDPFEDEVADAFEVPGFPMSIVTTASAALEAPSFLTGLYGVITLLIMLGIFLVLPIAAQITAGVKVSSLFSWRWWVVTSFCILILITISYIVFSYIRSPDSAKPRRR